VNPLDRLLLEPEPLSPAMLGMADEDELRARLGKYLQVAGFVSDPAQPLLQPTEVQRQHVLALIYGARIVQMEGELEEFEAVGDVRLKFNVGNRLARLTGLRDAALAAMTPPAAPVRRCGAVPEFEEWGLR
jgi:hypothetical protein